MLLIRSLFGISLLGALVAGALLPLEALAQSTVVGPSGPIRRQEKKQEPVKPLSEAVGETTDQMVGKVKSFFEKTGRSTDHEGKPIEGREAVDPFASIFAPGPKAGSSARPERREKPKASAVQPKLLAPLPPMQAEIEKPVAATDNPPIMVATRIDDVKNPLGIQVAKNKVQNLRNKMANESTIPAARNELFALRQWLIEATEAHVSLYQVLSKVPSARVQAEFEKQLALEFAKLRDEVLFQTGRYYAATNQEQKAVKELVEVIQSQARSDLGLEAYELLQEIGFTEQLQLANPNAS